MATAITSRNIGIKQASGLRFRLATLTMAADYATGGVAMTAASLGLSTILHVGFSGIAGFVLTWDATNSKIVIWNMATGAEAAANLAGLNGLTSTVFVIGY